MSPFYYRVITLLITSHNADEKRPRSRLYDSDADPAPAPAARRRRDELRKLELRISELQGAFDTERGRAIHLEAMLDARTKVTAELQSVLVNLKQFELERNLIHFKFNSGGPGGGGLFKDAHVLSDSRRYRLPTSAGRCSAHAHFKVRVRALGCQ